MRCDGENAPGVSAGGFAAMLKLDTFIELRLEGTMSSRFAVVMALIPGLLSAQSPDTTAVPRDLVRALLAFADFASGRDPQIVVGRVPDERLTAIVPKGARVLGGVTYQERRNPRTLTILSMSERPDSALVLVAKALESAGYKAAPTFERTLGESGGFVSSSIGPTMPGSAITYCTDASSMFASIMDGENRGSMVRMMSSSLRNTMCDPSMRRRLRGGRMDEIEMPTLRPPPGAVGGYAGSSGGGDHRQSTAQLQSALSAAEMVDHFAPQLREQGWTLGNRATDGDVSVLMARRTDKDGEPIHLALTDVRYTARDHDLTLRVWKESRPR
jgi:hypothetical protein